MVWFVLTRENSGKFYAWRDCAKVGENIIHKFLDAGDVVRIEYCKNKEDAIEIANAKNKNYKTIGCYIYD
jgi:hypothetical protein